MPTPRLYLSSAIYSPIALYWGSFTLPVFLTVKQFRSCTALYLLKYAWNWVKRPITFLSCIFISVSSTYLDHLFFLVNNHTKSIAPNALPEYAFKTTWSHFQSRGKISGLFLYSFVHIYSDIHSRISSILARFFVIIIRSCIASCSCLSKTSFVFSNTLVQYGTQGER